jgi:hypothetical protein
VACLPFLVFASRQQRSSTSPFLPSPLLSHTLFLPPLSAACFVSALDSTHRQMITYTTAVSGIAGRSVPIASGGDFVVRLAPPKQPLDGSTIDKNLPLAIDFRVSRDVMVAHSDAVRELLRLRPHMSCIAVENNSSYGISYAVEIWLWSIHGNYEDLPPSLKAFHYVRVWNVIAIGQRLGFSQHMHALKPWFLAIYRQTLDTEPGLTLTVARTLTWPCTVFDHAEGFMKLTKCKFSPATYHDHAFCTIFNCCMNLVSARLKTLSLLKHSKTLADIIPGFQDLVYNTNTSLLMHNPSMYHELTNEARLLNGMLLSNSIRSVCT